MSERVYEVWVDDEHFIAGFHYPKAKKHDAVPVVAVGHYRLASHCHFSLLTLASLPVGQAPYAWPDHVAPRSVVWGIRGEFPKAHVRSFDGVTRRRLR